jgi:hypothetical protein
MPAHRPRFLCPARQDHRAAQTTGPSGQLSLHFRRTESEYRARPCDGEEFGRQAGIQCDYTGEGEELPRLREVEGEPGALEGGPLSMA